MSLEEILLGGGGVLLAAMTLIQVAPIKVNPWSAVAKAIGRAINGEVIAKVDQLERDLVAMKAAQEERDAISCRSRILHFGDETIHGVRHTKEHFDQILLSISQWPNVFRARTSGGLSSMVSPGASFARSRRS